MDGSGRVDLRGLHAIVTGGASGIGLYITNMLLRHGAVVTIFDINPVMASEAITSLQSSYPGAQIAFHQCDVSSYPSQAAAFKAAFAQHERIDIVVANAGISAESKQPFFAAREDPDVPPPLKTLEVNLNGVLYTAHLAVHYIRKGGRGGTIMCTASNAGLYPFPVAPIYATAKHAVVGFVRSVGPVLAKEGITVNAIAPSIIKTNIAEDRTLFAGMIETPPSTLQDAVYELITNRKLTGKIAEMDESAENGIIFSQPPDYVNESTRHNNTHFEQLGYA